VRNYVIIKVNYFNLVIIIIITTIIINHSNYFLNYIKVFLNFNDEKRIINCKYIIKRCIVLKYIFMIIEI